MKKCNQCGAELPDNVKFCGNCGVMTTDKMDMSPGPDGDVPDAGVVKNQQDELGDQLRVESASTTESADHEINVKKDESPKTDTLKSGGEEAKLSDDAKGSGKVWKIVRNWFFPLLSLGLLVWVIVLLFEVNRLDNENYEYYRKNWALSDTLESYQADVEAMRQEMVKRRQEVDDLQEDMEDLRSRLRNMQSDDESHSESIPK